jgi:RNA polymerase sigma-70 factor (ECF subfamily)
MSELIEVWVDPMYYYVRRFNLSEEESMDVIQDVWLRVIQKFRQLRKPAAFPAWLFRIARNIVFSRFKKNLQFETVCLDENLSSISQEQDDTQLSGFTSLEIHESLDKLKVIHRECLVLRFIEGFSLCEVSIILGIPIGTVKSRLHHAKRALKCLLKVEVN